jgi:hypothetical protein
LLIKGLDKGLGNATLNTSEQQVLNCGDGDCTGGYVENSDILLTNLGYGLVSEADLPYTGVKAATCSNAITADTTRQFARFNNGIRGSSGTANDAQLLNLLNTYGPTTVLINAASDFLSYGGGIYANATCSRNYFPIYFSSIHKFINFLTIQKV